LENRKKSCAIKNIAQHHFCFGIIAQRCGMDSDSFFKLVFTEFVASLECIFESKSMERKAYLVIDSLSSHPAGTKEWRKK
jgi:hypothetical protein